jgi:hypothetical protein
MGYAKEGQSTRGIHMRLFSRAFIFDDGSRRNVFVSVDCGMIDQLLKIEVITMLLKTKSMRTNHETVSSRFREHLFCAYIVDLYIYWGRKLADMLLVKC